MNKNQNTIRWDQFNSIADNENLNLKEKGLLIILFRYVNHKTQYASPSRALIKKLTGISDNRTLDNLFASLINKNFLIRESGSKGKRSKYYLKLDAKITIDEENPLSVDLTSISSVEIAPIIDGKVTPQKENKIKENKTYIDLKFIDDSIDKVKITNQEYDKLLSKYDKTLINKTILGFDYYISNGSDKYKDHYKTLNIWCMNANNKQSLNAPVDEIITTNEQEFHTNQF